MRDLVPITLRLKATGKDVVLIVEFPGVNPFAFTDIEHMDEYNWIVN